MAVPIKTKLLGSGTAGPVAGTTVVCAEEFATVVDPSRFTLIVKANPINRIARKNGHCSCGVGEHAKDECAAGSRAVSETFEIIVEARPVVEAHGSWQRPANIAGQCRAAG
jgi:hypothetical protein